VRKRKASVRVPSLQHFSALLGGSSTQIEKRIRGLSKLPPVSYAQLRDHWIIDLIRLNVPISQIEKACSLLRGELNRKCNFEAIAAIAEYIHQRKLQSLFLVDKLYYPIGRGLQVPVNPAGVIVENGQPKVFWPSFWKRNKFDPLTGAVFGSILERSIFRLTDYRDLPLTFVDLSAEADAKDRSVKVLGRTDFGTLTDAELRAETDKFVEAYLRVLMEETASSRTEAEERSGTADLPLFLDRPPP
jgi:hypothetical protein